MKLSTSGIIVASTFVSCANGFAPALNNRAVFTTDSRVFVASAEEVATDEAAEPIEAPTIEINVSDEEKKMLKEIGVTMEEFALGISAKDFLEYVGTKETLIEKFKEDNKDFDDERANTEVSRFLMDAEMVNMYISFQKNPPDPNADLEQRLDDPKTIASYIALFLGGGSISYVNKNFIQPKIASGEWDGFHFPWESTSEAATTVSQSAGDMIDSTSGFFNALSDITNV